MESVRPRVALDVRGWDPRGRGIDLYMSSLLARWADVYDVEWRILAARTGPAPKTGPGMVIDRRSATVTRASRLPFVGSIQLSRRPRPDVLFLPNFGLYTRGEAPFVVTAHDATPLLYPEFFTPAERRWHRQVQPVKLLRSAERVIAVSEQTRREVRDLGVEDERITVIYEGIGEEYQPAPPDAISSVRRKYDLGDRPYFLYLGAVEPRKNVAALVQGFKLARTKGLDADLVIAGPVIDEQQLLGTNPHIHVLGWIEPEEKVPLYSGALAAVSLAKHEGFGMLPLEAIACNTTAILSRLGIYSETIGDSATYVEDDSPEPVAQALLDHAPNPRAVNQQARQRLLDKFSWDRCADKTLTVLLDVANHHP